MDCPRTLLRTAGSSSCFGSARHLPVSLAKKLHVGWMASLSIILLPVLLTYTLVFANDGWYNGPVIGIEFGQSYVRIAIAPQGKGHDVHLIPDKDNRSTIPSALCFTSEGILVGNETCTSPNEPLGGLRDLLPLVNMQGSSSPFDERVHRVLSQDRRFTRISVEPIYFSVSIREQSYHLTPLELCTHLFSHLRQVAEAWVGEPVTQAIVSVPSYFDDHQRNAIQTVGFSAGLEVLRVMNDGNAAIVAYELEEESYATVDYYILVATVNSTDAYLEVILYEDAVVEHLVSDLIESNKFGEAAIVDLLRLAELEPPRVMKVIVAGDSKSVAMNDLTGILDQLFPSKVTNGIHPDEVIVRGAALRAALWHSSSEDLMCVMPLLPFPIGVETRDGTLVEVLTRNAVYPIRSTRSVTLTRNPVNVFLGMSRGMSDVIYANESVYVGSVDVPWLGLSLGVPTEVNVSIAVDDSGLALNVTVGVADKYSSAVMPFPEIPPLTEDEIAEMVEDAGRFEQQDALLDFIRGLRSSAPLSEEDVAILDQTERWVNERQATSAELLQKHDELRRRWSPS